MEKIFYYKHYNLEDSLLLDNNDIRSISFKGLKAFLNKSDNFIIKESDYLFEANKINLIVGPSGSGKSTLLNYIACNYFGTKGINYEGKSYINNCRIKSFYDIKPLIGFVEQIDILDEKATVYQYLYYIAKLLGIKNIDKKIDEILYLLNLYECKYTLIGDSLNKGLSGGEKKRLNIAIQMLKNPQILILDEPTTGLDSYNALNILEILNNLKSENRIIIVTLHQPSFDIINLIDTVTVISEGYLLYQGNVNNIEEYFRQFYPEEKYINIETILRLLDKDTVRLQLENTRRKESINDDLISSTNTDNFKAISNYFNETNNYSNIIKYNDYLNIIYNQKISKLKMFQIILIYYLRLELKNKKIFLMNIIQILVLTIIQTIIYSHLGNYNEDTILAINNRKGFCFISNLIFINIGISNSSKCLFPIKKILEKEYYNNLYDIYIVYIVLFIKEYPKLILNILFYSVFTCLYFKLYENDIVNIFKYFIVYFLQYFSIFSICLLISVYYERPQDVSNTTNMIVVPFNMVSGFISNVKSMPFYMRYISILSNTKYGFQALILLIFETKRNDKSCFKKYYNIDICNFYRKETPCIIKLDYDKMPECNPFNVFDFKETYLTNILSLLIIITVCCILGIITISFKFKMINKKNKIN